MRVDRAKFAAAMVKRDFRAYELAEAAKVSRGTVTAVRSGKSCSRDTVEKLAAGLGVQVADILETA